MASAPRTPSLPRLLACAILMLLVLPIPTLRGLLSWLPASMGATLLLATVPVRLAPKRVACTDLRDARDAVLRYLGFRKRWTSMSAIAPSALLHMSAGIEPPQEPRYLLVGDGSAHESFSASTSIMRRLCAVGSGGSDVRDWACAAESACAQRRPRVLVYQPTASVAARLSAAALAGGWAHCGWALQPLAVGAVAGAVQLQSHGGAAARVDSVVVTTVDAIVEEEGWSGGRPGSIVVLQIGACAVCRKGSSHACCPWPSHAERGTPP